MKKEKFFLAALFVIFFTLCFAVSCNAQNKKPDAMPKPIKGRSIQLSPDETWVSADIHSYYRHYIFDTLPARLLVSADEVDARAFTQNNKDIIGTTFIAYGFVIRCRWVGHMRAKDPNFSDPVGVVFAYLYADRKTPYTKTDVWNYKIFGQ